MRRPSPGSLSCPARGPTEFFGSRFHRPEVSRWRRRRCRWRPFGLGEGLRTFLFDSFDRGVAARHARVVPLGSPGGAGPHAQLKAMPPDVFRQVRMVNQFIRGQELMGGVRRYLHHPPRPGALSAAMAQKPKNQAGAEQKRQDRYPDQYRTHDGERDHGDDDTDKQHKERQANRPEPGYIEALGGARGRCIWRPSVRLPIGAAPALGGRNDLRLQTRAFRLI